MNKKYDDDFFEDLDKTTDLLKAFKPHLESKTDDLDQLFNEYMNSFDSEDIEQSEVDELTRSIQPIRSMEEAIQLEKQIQQQKEEQELLKIEEEVKQQIEREREIERQRRLKIEQAEAKVSALFTNKSSKKQEEQVHQYKNEEQEKSDINEIISKMSVEAEKREQERVLKEQKRIEKLTKKKQIKKSNVKFSKFELSFCALSFIFIIGCVLAFGFGKDNKTEVSAKTATTSVSTITNALSKTKPVYDGDGLYLNSGNYVFKGKDVNNYLKYSNMLWRIIKTNSDGTIDVVLDNSINSLPWGTLKTSYLESDIRKYLNSYFIKYIDTEYLEKVTVCTDEVNDLRSFKCNETNNEDYVRLLTLEEFLESKNEGSYLTDVNSMIWLSTTSKDKIWKISGNNATLGDANKFLQIKPVIKIKGNLELLSGTGTKEDPFKITNDKNGVQVGSYVKLDNDVYVVYDIANDKLKMSSTQVLPNIMFNPSVALFDVKTTGTLGWYLNTTYFNTLTYKDLLVNAEWYNGHYTTSYENSFSAKVVSKIGILDISALKFDDDMRDYYISNSLNRTDVLVYSSESYGVKPRDRKNVRTTICILNKKVISGTGSKEDPFILEK